jgi:hypothetical protein
MLRSLHLIDDLIEIAKAQQEELYAYRKAAHKALKTVGDTSLLFHLQTLKELIQEESKMPSTVVLDGKSFEVSLGKTPVGCVDHKYCYTCKIDWWSTICVCGLYKCKKCGGLVILTPPESKEGWKKISYDNGRID